MTISIDPHLRELQNRLRASGSAADEVALLLERLRVGDLTAERLELAAALGHEPARTISSASPRMRAPADLLRWGKPVVVRGAIAIARLLCDRWSLVRPDDRRPHACVEAAQGWLDCPCPAHLRAARAVAREAGPLPAAWAKLAEHDLHPAGWVPNVLWVVLSPCARNLPPAFTELVDAAERAVGADRVREHAFNVVRAWALGPCRPPT